MTLYNYVKSIGLKWYFFTQGAFVVYDQFSHVYMKQFGLNPQQIGASNLFGVQHIFLPLLFFLADKYRARNLLTWLVAIICFTVCLLPLLPMVVSLPSCFGTKSNNFSSILTRFANRNGSVHFENAEYGNSVPWLSNLFAVMTISRSLMLFLEMSAFTLAAVATFSYLGNDRASYGLYYMWKSGGACILAVAAAILAWKIGITICGVEGYGYFACLLVAGAFLFLSVICLPVLEFKYDDDRTANWTDIRRVLFRGHYMYILVLDFYFGNCVAFQVFWEFWYLDGLAASPAIMGAAVLVRSAIMTISIYTSCYIIRRIGELYAICVSYLLFSLSFLALSFTRVYYYVLGLDALQGIAYGLAASAFSIYFSKIGTEATSTFILGLLETFFVIGLDCGATIFGFLFHSLGTRRTLLLFSVMTGAMLAILFVYVKCSNQAYEYEKLSEKSDEDDDEDGRQSETK